VQRHATSEPPDKPFRCLSSAPRSGAATSAGPQCLYGPYSGYAITLLISADCIPAPVGGRPQSTTVAPRPVTPVVAVPLCAAPSRPHNVRAFGKMFAPLPFYTLIPVLPVGL